MFRILSILLILCGFGGVAYWLMHNPGHVEVTWLGYQLSFPIFVAVLFFFLVLFGLIIITRVIFWMLRIPSRIGQWWQNDRREKGEGEFLDLVVAVEGESVPEALKHQKRAQKTKSTDPLFWWYSGQAFGLAGKNLDETKSYANLSDKASFLGLKGQALSALKRGDNTAALENLVKAREMTPNSPWVLHTLFGLLKESKQYGEAENILNRLQDYGHITRSKGQKELASLLALKAHDPLTSSQDREASLRQAHYLDPSLVNVTYDVAELLVSKGHVKYALSAIESTWALNPCFKLAAFYIACQKPDSSVKAYEMAQKLAAFNPKSPLSQTLLAEKALDAKLWGEARETIKKLLKSAPSPKVYGLMARLEMEENNNLREAHTWALKGCLS